MSRTTLNCLDSPWIGICLTRVGCFRRKWSHSYSRRAWNISVRKKWVSLILLWIKSLFIKHLRNSLSESIKSSILIPRCLWLHFGVCSFLRPSNTNDSIWLFETLNHTYNSQATALPETLTFFLSTRLLAWFSFPTFRQSFSHEFENQIKLLDKQTIKQTENSTYIHAYNWNKEVS